MPDVAIAHDQVLTNGGAERVTFELAREFDAPVYTMAVDDSLVPDDIDVVDLSSRLGQFCMDRHYLVEDLYQMVAWNHQEELYEYDVILQSKTNPYWFVPCSDYQTVIRYCHSTPRNLYDQHDRRGGNLLGDTMKIIQRLLYQQVYPYADAWVANSDIVARRIEAYADPATADIEVVYPPVATGNTGPDLAPTKDYLLSVGRLAVNKRINLLRDVAEAVDYPVVVAGDGPYRDELLEDKPENLEYVGYIDEYEKWRRYSEAKATLMLAESEDFGIVPIESMAAGTPVIGPAEGFTRHQIRDGETGYLCTPTVESVVGVIDKMHDCGVAWSDERIAAYADQFSGERFRREIRDIVASVHAQAQPDPNIDVPAPVDSDVASEPEVVADGGE